MRAWWTCPFRRRAPGEVLVRVEAVGICGSDLELLKGTRDAAFAATPSCRAMSGPASSPRGRPRIRHLPAGTRVVVEGHHFCGACGPCRAGRTHLCAHYDEYGFTRDGGYREYVAARADLCHPLTHVDLARGARRADRVRACMPWSAAPSRRPTASR